MDTVPAKPGVPTPRSVAIAGSAIPLMWCPGEPPDAEAIGVAADDADITVNGSTPPTAAPVTGAATAADMVLAFVAAAATEADSAVSAAKGLASVETIPALRCVIQ
ncbi:hypothetical protein NIIDMKKI_20350 [Mycobacterium kansasii]|uniref:Uncharacterized protein n=1 Tax=Mycobacterium kansasii TaxID=1768 RepID=A0A7G1IBB9_MYCKA|nr:hypothetical protein NIIDMKKI_20350 [Mycobacterium kansasii]